LLIGLINEFCIAFYIHQIIAPVVEEMKDPSWKRIMNLTWVSGGVCWVVTFFIPLFAFLCNPTAPSGIILLSLNEHAPEVIAGIVIVLILCLLSDSFFTFIIAKELAEFICPGASRSRVVITLTGFTTSLLSIGLNKLPAIPAKVAGEIVYQSFISLAYILPPAYYLATFGFRLRWAAASVFVLVVGLLISGWSLAIFVQGLITSE
jgi:amino acid permease